MQRKRRASISDAQLQTKIPEMTPFEEAHQIAVDLGMDFNGMMNDHLREGYVYSSPECFICAMDTARDFGEYSEFGVFVTLAVGNLNEFVRIDPLKNERKWLGYCRQDKGEIHWLDYRRLLRKASSRTCKAAR
jgi:hypothetical protein